jgi:hypothetical protein
MKKMLSCFLTVLFCGILLYGCEKQTVDSQTVQVANNDTEFSEPDFPEPGNVTQTTVETVPSGLAFSSPDFPEEEISEWPTIDLTTDELPILFALNGLYGYLNNQLRVIIPPIYDHGLDYNDQGYTQVRYQGVRYRFEYMVLNWNGETIFHEFTADLNILFDDIVCLNYSLPRVIRLRDGKVIADRLGTMAESADDGIILVSFFKNAEEAFIDSSGKRILPDLKMAMTTNTFQEGRAAITDDNWDIHIIDINGRSYGDLNFFRTGRYFSEGLLPAETKERVTGYINREGEFAFNVPIVARIRDDDWSPLLATNFKDGYALIQTSLEPPVWRVINNMGDFISDELFIFEASAFADGLSRIRTTGTVDSKYGYINTKGETVIDPVFDSASSFVRGYARIVYEGRDALINTEGEIFWCDEFVTAQNE